MRICVYGAGAVGGAFAVRLALAGHDVSVVARGAHLAAIRATGGLALVSDGERREARVAASDDPADLGVQDVVLVTLKAHQLADFALAAAPLLDRDTVVVFAQNGIPWWYADGLPDGVVDREALAALDPAGSIRRLIGPARSLGGVIYSSNNIVEPGVVANHSPRRNRLVIGEIDDGDTARVRRLRRTLTEAGIDSPAVAPLRQAIWQKLTANLSVSILSFLVERTSREVYDDPHLSPIVERLAGEAIAIAAAHGYACSVDSVGPAPGHRSSMLQDVERGRPIELDALLLVPRALARSARVPIPTLETVVAMVMHKLDRAVCLPPDGVTPSGRLLFTGNKL